MRMLKTFLRELTTQSNTAFSLGTRLIVLSGRSTRKTRSDLIVFSLAVMSEVGAEASEAVAPGLQPRTDKTLEKHEHATRESCKKARLLFYHARIHLLS